MGHVLDLGVSEAYRHEAVATVEAATSALQEIITVRCECGDAWEMPCMAGTYDEFEESGDPAPYLEEWQRHVWAEIREAGQSAEAAKVSAEIRSDYGRDDEGHNPPPYSDEPSSVSITIRPAVPAGPEREAAARSTAWMYLENIERRVKDAKAALNTPAGDFGQGTRIPTMRTWAQQIAEQAGWLQEDLNRIEKGE